MNTPASPNSFHRRTKCLSLCLGLSLAALSSPSAHAQLYWNAASPGTGNWNAATANWNTDAGGANPNTTYVGGSDAVFSAGTSLTGTFITTVQGAQTANSLTFQEGTTVSIAGNTSPSLSIGAGGVSITGATTAVNLNSSAAITIGAAQSWTNTGSGLLTVNGGLTISNQLTLSSGTVSFTVATNSGAGGVKIDGANVVTSQAGAFGTGTLTLNTGSLRSSTAADLALSSVLALTGGFEFKASTTGNRHLTFTGGGTISGAPTITFSDNALGTAGGTQFTTGALTLNSNVTFAGAGVATISSVIAQDATPRSLTYSGSGTTASLTLGGANSFSGNTKITGGTLTVSNALALQNSALDTANSIAGTATAGLKTSVTTLTLGGLTGNKDLASVFTTTSGGYSGVTSLTINPGTGVTNTYSGAIANGAAAMALTKTGAGTQTFSGANTYTGITTVSLGTLLINGTHAGAGAYSVDTGTLGGEGTITSTSAVTIGSAGKLSAGSAAGTVGTLTLAGSGGLNLSSAITNEIGEFVFNLDTVGASDKISLTSGTLTIGTGLNFADFNFTTTGNVLDGNVYHLFTSTSSISGSLDTTTANLTGSLGGGLSGTVGISGNDIILTVAVPEPSTVVYLLSGLALLIGNHVFRKRRAGV